jgi:glycosyltransferase 2 family protein
VLYADLQAGGGTAPTCTVGRLRCLASIGCHSFAPGGRMHRFLTALQRGFHDWIGWKRLGIAASLLIIVIAVTTLIRMLKGVDVNVILLALRDTSPGQIGLAALCVACAFFTLTFYDLFALRTIGKKHVPYRIAALSSFTSYTIGHNVGATVFTGGAIRFRIYSEWGLSAIDVAKICFVSGLTFWLGNLFVLGVGMTWHPEAATPMNLLPSGINRLIGIGCVAGIAAYLVWLALAPGRRELGQNGWKVVLPSARLTLLQIAIGVVDLGFCALAMYLLMPAQPHIDFVSLAVVFILATLLGFASHAPGSLGVFDAAMLVALPQFSKEHLLAALLVFRMLYFVIPFMISITVLASRELWYNVIQPWRDRRRMQIAEAAVSPGE